jgi:hypothetical protein
MEKMGFGLLAMLQRSWATVVRQDPEIAPGDWVAYRDCSLQKQLRKDVLYEERAKVLEVGHLPKDSATAEWYEPDLIMGIMTHAPLANGEVWHLDKQACFMLSAGEDNTKPNIVELSPDRDLYVVAGRDENGDKIKLSLRIIHMDDENMHPVEQYGPSFIKRNENRHLYKCQMFRACYNSIKENAWVRDYGIDLKEVRRAHLNTYADSKVKGFMWLFTSHALLVGTRLCSKDACNRCPHCIEVEDIKHMAYDCCVAQYIRKKVFKEWWFCTTESRWYNHPTFEEAFFSEGTSTFEVLRRTLNDIATYHIWKLRCNILYREELIPSPVTANNIWVEFTQTLKVRLSHIKAKANW